MVRAALLAAVWSLGCRGPRDDGALRRMPRAPVRDGGAPAFSAATLAAAVGADPGTAIERVTTWAPLDVALVRARVGGRWTAWAVDGRGARTGLAGAERVLRGWARVGYQPFTEELARAVGFFAFPSSTVLARRDVGETDAGLIWVPAPSLAPDGRGARALSFSHRDASGVVRAARFTLAPDGTVRGDTSSLTPRAGATENPPR